MKKPNSICEFKEQRSRLLLENFRESIRRQSQISAQRAFREAIDTPAPRFWVSEARAAAVVKMMMRGEDPTENMLPEKRKMFLEIFQRVSDLLEKEPDTPVGDAVFRVVNGDAPNYYMSIKHAQRLIRDYRNELKSRKGGANNT